MLRDSSVLLRNGRNAAKYVAEIVAEMFENLKI